MTASKLVMLNVMSVEARVPQIWLNNKGLIRLLATIEGERERERELHQRFQESRLIVNVRMGGLVSDE